MAGAPAPPAPPPAREAGPAAPLPAAGRPTGVRSCRGSPVGRSLDLAAVDLEGVQDVLDVFLFGRGPEIAPGLHHNHAFAALRRGCQRDGDVVALPCAVAPLSHLPRIGR